MPTSWVQQMLPSDLGGRGSVEWPPRREAAGTHPPNPYWNQASTAAASPVYHYTTGPLGATPVVQGVVVERPGGGSAPAAPIQGGTVLHPAQDFRPRYGAPPVDRTMDDMDTWFNNALDRMDARLSRCNVM
eukprot:TRINITY_DN113011_c0_g1_i1.p1 TRINITY_DN113011_c0_g1~~TRINITY_DN113011_c0_g1_i1.p1  ORF type:complete len:151 (+),score=23.21 TRINITY_DN113011_c0_g1_i1:62-454(+)